MNAPKVSVIIPTYNRTDLISRSIKSVLDQSFSDLEIIVSLDGSPEETVNVVKSWAEKDERVKYINNERFGSTAKPFNNALKISQGEFIALQGDDDKWAFDKLEKQLKAFEKNEQLGIVFTGIYEISSDKKIKKIAQGPHNLKRLLTKNYLSTPSVLIKKEALDYAGEFDENLKYLDDWDMWIRIAQKYNFTEISEPLTNYYRHGQNLTSTAKSLEVAHELEYLIKKFQNLYDNDKKALAYRYLKIAEKFYLAKDKARAKEYIKKIFTLRKDFKSLIRFLLTKLNLFFF